MGEIDFNHDKTVRVIEDLLKSYPDGLTITDIIKKTGLARNTILTRLYFLVGRGNVGMRQINMAKLHYWKGDVEPVASSQESVSNEKKDNDVQVVALKEEHLKKVLANPKDDSKKADVPDEIYAHNEKDGDWKKEKNAELCINLINEAGDAFEKGDLNKAKESYRKIQKIYSLISPEAKEHLAPGIEKVIEEINKKEIHLFIDKYFKLAESEGLSDKISEKIKSLSSRLSEDEQKEIEEKLNSIKNKDKVVVEEKKEENKEIKVVEEKKDDSTKKRKYGKLDFAAIKAAVRSGNMDALKDKSEEPEEEIVDDDENFIKTHVPGFDKLMDKGIPKGSAILMAGGCGSGKTLFSLQTLVYQANKGKKCLFMSFEETEERLVEHMESFGWNARELVEKGLLVIRRFNPYDITRSVDALLMKAKGELLIDVDPIIFPPGFNPDFIVVDSLTAIGSAFASKEDSYRIYIEQLFRFFENIKATSFLITETQQIPTVFSTTGVEEFLADGVFVIYNFKRGNMRENAMEILKLRGAKHKKKLAAMKVTSKGIVVYPDQEVYGGAKDQ